MKKFKMTSRTFPESDDYQVFTEETAPKWLKEGGIKGSTMCNRWFWNGHVMTLPIGGFVLTDFKKIVRIE